MAEMAEKRSKITTIKASTGLKFIIKQSFSKRDEDQLGNKYGQTSAGRVEGYYTMEGNGDPSDPMNCLVEAAYRVEFDATWEGKGDPWERLNGLMELANKTEDSNIGGPGSAAEKGPLYLHDDGAGGSETKIKKQRKGKSKVTDDDARDNAPSDSERPTKKCKVRVTKADNDGEFMAPPQVVLDASRAKSGERITSVWFSLVAHEESDGSIPIYFIQKYVKEKLDLPATDEVDIKCMGETVCPSFTLNDVVEIWHQTTSTKRVKATIGSSAKDFVMELSYARRPNLQLLKYK